MICISLLIIDIMIMSVDWFRMKTWRKFKPFLLCPVMKQTKSTCYAIAYVRQLELNKKMRLDEHLSIQNFINLISKDFLNHEHLSYVCDNI